MTFFSRAWSFRGAGIKMHYWMLVLFWLLALAVALIGYFTNGIVEIILEVVTYIMGIFGMWVCAN